jgi:hypothetical protein
LTGANPISLTLLFVFIVHERVHFSVFTNRERCKNIKKKKKERKKEIIRRVFSEKIATVFSEAQEAIILPN